MGAKRRQRQTGMPLPNRAVIDRHNRQDGYTWQQEARARAQREAETWRHRPERLDEEEAA